MNLEEPLRSALLASDDIPQLLGTWQDVPAIHTRRPIPKEAEALPCILVGPDISNSDMDGLTARRPIITRDIVVYGQQTEDYRTINDIAWLVRQLFHRARGMALSIEGYHLISVVATGPFIGPTEDDTLVARIVMLTITLDKE